jgi:hypothetical protein
MSLIKDDTTRVADESVEIADDLSAARRGGLKSAGTILADSGGRVWNGQPCCMWVPDQPNGLSNTLLNLELSARDRDAPP